MADYYVKLPTGHVVPGGQPVANAAALPTTGNRDGDLRITLNDDSLYVWKASSNAWIEAATPAATSAITALNTDVSANGPGAVIATIQPNVVTNAKAAQMPANTLKGNNTGALANAADLTTSQVQTLLSYITALTGDATASGPGSIPLTLAIVNSNVGSFGNAASSLSATVNAKGLVTAVAAQAIQITESQVTNLVSDLAGKQASLGFTPENAANKTTDGTLAANSNTLYPSESAVKTYVDGAPAGLPSNVLFTPINKSQVFLSHDGLLLQQLDSATQTNTAGAFNGGGTGQKTFVEFTAYNNLALSSLSTLAFTAKDARELTTNSSTAWNILMNFNNGFLTAANDYCILDMDDSPNSFLTSYIFTQSYVTYTVDFTSRVVKAVGGTGLITFTGTTSVGSNIITAVSGSNINALTVGMFIRKLPTGSTPGTEVNLPFPDGTTITSINVGANTFTMSANATLAQAGITLNQYGGIAPDTRASTANGTTTVTIGARTSDAVVTTADLQVNMQVTGIGVPANSYIVSIVANTSITLNNSVTTGSPTLTFVARGKTGIPGNAALVGIPMTTVVSNNPNAFITNNAPMTPIWAVADAGAPKNVVYQGGIQIIMGGSGVTGFRTNAFKNVTINSDVYTFAR